RVALEPHLSDPLGISRQPAVRDHLAVEAGRKAPASPSQAQRDEIAVRTHDRRDLGRGVLRYLSDIDRVTCERRTCSSQVRRPQGASNQKGKKAWRTFSIASGSPEAEPPG